MSEFYVGFGREDISNDTVLPLNSTRSSGTILTPIKVTCVCLSDGEKKALIFSNDLRNTTARIAADIKEKVSEATGVPAEDMFIVATHNHSAPDVNYYDTPEVKDWLFRIAYPGAVKAAREAIADLTPAKAFAGKSLVDGVTYVRRYFREDGTFFSINAPKISDAPFARHETESDRELRALRFVREGKKDVVLVNFQVHAATAAVTAREYVCADFIHHLREDAEAEDEILVCYLQGGCGNLNTYTKLPWEIQCNGDYILAGKRLAIGLKEALSDVKELKTGKLCIQNASPAYRVNHEKSHLAKKVIEMQKEFAENGVTNAKEKNRLFVEAGFASRYEASAIVRRSRMKEEESVPLSSVCFGDVGLTFTPFETFDVNSRQVREASPFKMTFTCGYTNAYMSYLPSAYGFFNSGYEILQSYFIPGTGEEVSLELLRQLKEAKKALNG